MAILRLWEFESPLAHQREGAFHHKLRGISRLVRYMWGWCILKLHMRRVTPNTPGPLAVAVVITGVLIFAGFLIGPSIFGKENGQVAGARTLFSVSSWPKDSDPYTFESAQFDDKTLRVNVAYGGGCGDHDFTLFASQQASLLDPPSPTIVLHHDDNGDSCSDVLTETLYFNLGNYIEEIDTTEIRFKLDSYNDGLRTITWHE